ncbi:MAG: hypothetical protein KDJ41_08805 [Hyphomicrobiaceae bacterium]|nr:hypothetical protein [Hyphomicrobiaceae bacterium]
MTSPERTLAVLERLLEVIAEEARRNASFARRLGEAITSLEVPAGEATPETPAPTRRVRAGVRGSQPADLHAVNLLRRHGEGVLRGKLEQVRDTARLRAVAAASGLVLTGAAAGRRATRADLVDAIVAAARLYVAQRAAASAV